jgi:hypothetical protein
MYSALPEVYITPITLFKKRNIQPQAPGFCTVVGSEMIKDNVEQKKENLIPSYFKKMK